MARSRTSDVVPRGALRALVLATLADGDLHGYALARKLEDRARGTLRIREGSLYPALHELELEGAVEATWTRAPDGRRRRVYSLTRAGKRAAKGARDEWLAIAEMISALLRA
ncbi:MAG TPA: helix-turn-helix transcriptional regulator [Kofleriaceae bacterium]|nr:helix-turn-helix transcriptional regulator [Kofleriaceae bacterium]